MLITGGAGFIGGHLAAAAAADGWRVDIAENFRRGVEDAFLVALLGQPAVRLCRIDLTDVATDGLDDDYDVIVHLAAIVGVRHVLADAATVLADNVRMTLGALDIARRQRRLSRFLFASTSEVTAGTLAEFGTAYPIPTPETVPLVIPDLGEARTSYMLSKIYGEALCRQSGLPVTVFRPHNIYGPRMGMSHVIPEMLARAEAARDGDVFDVPSSDHTRAFCYVDDAVELLMRLMSMPATGGGTFNLGNQDEEIAIAALAEIVAATVGRQLEIVARPAAPGSPARRCPDMAKTIAATGYAPKVDIRDGVARTHAWYRANVYDGAGATAQ